MTETGSLAEASHCRVYDGTPEKVGKKRLLEISTEEKKPVFRAVLFDDVGGCSLRDSELLITHRAIKNDNEKLVALAATGCSELVVVVEGLRLLQEDFDLEFRSLSGMSEFSAHVELLMKDIQVEGKETFSAFCFALRKAMVSKPDTTPDTPRSYRKSSRVVAQRNDDMVMDAVKNGIGLYDAVGEAVMQQTKHANNAHSREICKFSVKSLRAWSDLYSKTRDRNILSHPFKFIHSDLCTARRALNVLVYIVDHGGYHTLTPLLKAALPRISVAVAQREADIKQEEAELDAEDKLVEAFVGRLQV